MKIALYARVSTSDQNCEMQLQELKSYALARNWQVVGEFKDEGWVLVRLAFAASYIEDAKEKEDQSKTLNLDGPSEQRRRNDCAFACKERKKVESGPVARKD